MPKLYHQEGEWIVPGQQAKHATRADIPSTPAELAHWLNERKVAPQPIAASKPIEPPLRIEPAQAIPTATPATPAINATMIEQWLMDSATTAQVERIFTALGVRFHELRKAAQSC